MTIEPEGQGHEIGDVLRDQAAAWFARMRGPDADRFRKAHHEWLAQSTSHRAAYTRIEERFADAGVLRTRAENNSFRPAPWFVRQRAQIAATLGLILIVAAAILVSERKLLAPAVPTSRVFASTLLSGKNMRRPPDPLADGSKVQVQPGSLLSIRFSSARRDLKLAYGAARFWVAHEQRPFIVRAGATTVTAHGTIFDVALDPSGNARVALLSGSVFVESLGLDGRNVGRLLTSGEIYRGQSFQAPRSPAKRSSNGEELASFNQAEVQAIIDRANRAGSPKILVPDQQLGSLRVSGAFGVGNPEVLATELAALLDLNVRRAGDTILLEPSDRFAKRPLIPPSGS